MKKILYILPIFLLLACSSKKSSEQPEVLESELTQGTVTCYGAYYKGLERNVVSLDLYSKDITFDSLGYVNGTGTNLYISDLFLPLTDTVPTAGTYKCDTTTAVSTFLPGMDFEGNPTGTYILRINDSKISSIILCNDSSFVLSRNGETTDIQFNLIADKKQYKLHFRGVLKYEDKRQHL